MADERTVADIEHDLAVARQRLSENLAQLVTEVHPKAVVHRTVAEGKRQAREAWAQGKQKVQDTCALALRQFKDESGWKPERLAIAGGAVAVIVTVVVLVAAKKK